MKTRLLPLCALLLGALLLTVTPADLPAGEGTHATIRVKRVFPNPFTTSTTFQLTMPSSDQIYIAVYDIMGRHVRTLFEGFHTAGEYPIFWDGNDVNGIPVDPGTYVCSLFAGKSYVKSVKVVKIRG